MPVPTAVLARRGKLEPAFLDPTTDDLIGPRHFDT